MILKFKQFYILVFQFFKILTFKGSKRPFSKKINIYCTEKTKQTKVFVQKIELSHMCRTDWSTPIELIPYSEYSLCQKSCRVLQVPLLPWTTILTIHVKTLAVRNRVLYLTVKLQEKYTVILIGCGLWALFFLFFFSCISCALTDL